MNERYKTAIGAIIIAVAFFLGGVYFEKQRAGPTHGGGVIQDVNPIGFHAEGQVQVTNQNFSLSSCTNQKCTIRFDFVTSAAPPNTQKPSCTTVASNCFFFNNFSMSAADLPGATNYPDAVWGVVEVQ